MCNDIFDKISSYLEMNIARSLALLMCCQRKSQQKGTNLWL